MQTGYSEAGIFVIKETEYDSISLAFVCDLKPLYFGCPFIIIVLNLIADWMSE